LIFSRIHHKIHTAKWENFMKKYVILAIGIVLVSSFGFFGWKWNKSQNGSFKVATTTSNFIDKNFQIAGNLIRNNPGLKANTWYLNSDLVGSSADQLELIFNPESDCSLGNQKIDCYDINFPNGTRVRVSGEKDGEILRVLNFTAETASDLIYVDKITSNDTVSSPLTITGKARGQWFFEASFPVRLVDSSGVVVTTSIAQAGSDWMTTDFVPFSVILNFDVTTRTPAELVLAADNPSGLPQNDREIKVPVVLMPRLESKEIKTSSSTQNLN
jgi:hypothetical protein